MTPTSISPDAHVSRNRIVYAKDGHMLHASYYKNQRTLRQWDYYLNEHGGLAGITGRDGKLVGLRLRNNAIYLTHN